MEEPSWSNIVHQTETLTDSKVLGIETKEDQRHMQNIRGRKEKEEKWREAENQMDTVPW